MKKILLFQIVYSIFILGLFYYLGFEIYFLIFIAILFVLIIALKGKLYTKVKSILEKKFPAISKLPSWLHKLIIILFFVLVYFLLKEIIFIVLKNFGIDVQKMMIENVNQSLMN